MAPLATYSDAYGLPVTTHSPQALDWYNQGVDGLLGFRKDTPDCFQKALALDPTFNMAHSGLGVHYFLEESADMVDKARACFEKARDHINRLTERERDVLATLDLWAHGKVREAIDRMQASLQVRPREVVLLQRLYFIYFVQGDAERFRDLIATVLPHYDNDAYLLGMYSFGLEETGDFAAALATGQEALARHREDVWALHALAHVTYETGAFTAGVGLLDDGLTHCDQVGTFRHHILWHLALFLWEQGRRQRTLTVYHEQFANPATCSPPELVDAVSLLWRLNLTGCPTPEEWQALMPSLDSLRQMRTYLFNQMHIALGLTGAGRLDWARAYLQDLQARVRPDRSSLLGDVGVPLVEGLIAHAQGEYVQVVHKLAPIREHIVNIGGSHAQRELFRDILLDACLQTGEYTLAGELVQAKRHHRPDRPLALLALENVSNTQGHTARAAEARARAWHLWQEMQADPDILQSVALA